MNIANKRPTVIRRLTCGVCTERLNQSDPYDDLDLQICGTCKPSPQGRRWVLNMHSQAAAPVAQQACSSAHEWLKVVRPPVTGEPSAQDRKPGFNEAELALIQNLGRSGTAAGLLRLINARRLASGTPVAQLEDLMPYLPQAAAPLDPSDWPSLRRVLVQARRSGVLKAITGQVIDDFAVVFALNPKQVLVLKETVLKAAEDERQAL